MWWQLPALMNWGVTHVLEQQGLNRIAVRISDVGLSRAYIERLEAAYEEPDTTLLVKLKGVHLNYSWSQLISGHIENLIVDSTTIQLDHRPDPQVTASPTLPNIDLLLAAYSAVDPASLPITEVQLPSIKISHNLASEHTSTFDSIELRAELSKRKNRFNLDIFFANQETLTWVVDKETGWRVQYFDTPTHLDTARERQPVFDGALNQVKRSLVFNAKALPELSQSRLFPTEQIESSEQNFDPLELSEVTVAGTLQSNATASGLLVSSTMVLHDLAMQNGRMERVNAQVDVEVNQVRKAGDQAHWLIQLRPNSVLSTTNLSFEDWQADEMTLNLGGNLSLGGGTTEFSSSALLLTVSKLKQASELELSGTSFAGKLSATIDNDEWRLDFAESWRLSSEYVRLDGTEFDQGIAIHSIGPSHALGNLKDRIKLGKTELKISVPVVTDESLPLQAHPADASLRIHEARVNQGQPYAKGSLSIPEFTIIDNSSARSDVGSSQDNNIDANKLQFENLEQNFEFDRNLFTSRGHVDSVQRGLHLQTLSKHEVDKQRGYTTFRFGAITFDNPQRLRQLVPALEFPATLITGELELSGRANWAHRNGEWQAEVGIDALLENLGGAYDEAYFSGVNGRLSLQIYPEILSTAPQQLKVSHADAGVVCTDTMAEFTLRPSKFGDLPIIEILQAQTQLLQGRLSLKPGSYDLNREKQDLRVILDNIDLNELVRMQQLEGIQATGLLSGQLPVLLNNGEISIDNGQLQAMAPGGTLRYNANEEALAANEYTETVMLALKNFNYDVLRADTNYEPDGTLLLKLQLQGNNPDFEQGRQVNLNINLEQNVLKLLESLRLIEGVSDRLDKQVQDFYRQTTSP